MQLTLVFTDAIKSKDLHFERITDQNERNNFENKHISYVLIKLEVIKYLYDYKA